MKEISTLCVSGLIGIIGLIIYLIADDYWEYHPDYWTKKKAYVIRQLMALLGRIYVPYLVVLEIIMLILFWNN